MGGPMSYQRMRNRNGLMYRVPEGAPGGPYAWDSLPADLRRMWDARGGPRGAVPTNLHCLAGDMNRMERDYLGDNYNLQHSEEVRARNSCDLGLDVSKATGVPLGDVRKVLRYVFFEQP